MNFVDRLFVSVLFFMTSVLLFLVSKGWDFLKLINVDIVNFSYFWIVFVVFICFVTCWHLFAACWQRYITERHVKKIAIKNSTNNYSPENIESQKKTTKEIVVDKPVEEPLPVFNVLSNQNKPLEKTIDELEKAVDRQHKVFRGGD